MNSAELNYVIHEKEMLVIVCLVTSWHAELLGIQSKIDIISDRKFSEYFMATKKLTARQACWSEILPQFSFSITYHSSKENKLVDALSRRDDEIYS